VTARFYSAPSQRFLWRQAALGADFLRRSVHVRLNFTLPALVCIHGVVAPKHHFVDRDAVPNRMLPRSWKL